MNTYARSPTPCKATDNPPMIYAVNFLGDIASPVPREIPDPALHSRERKWNADDKRREIGGADKKRVAPIDGKRSASGDDSNRQLQ